MKLHHDPNVFEAMIQATADHMKLPDVYIEKDYWITQALKRLAASKHVKDTVFKGGTSLSKAYRMIDRFSEDIDLAIFTKDLNGNQIKRKLKEIETVVAEGLTPKPRDDKESKGSTFRKTVHSYPIIMTDTDYGQASPDLLIEVNAFTQPDPVVKRPIQTFIAEMLHATGRSDLVGSFQLEAFNIQILSVNRTLVEKLLGIVKDSYSENPVGTLSNRIRHLYDICQILKEKSMRSYVSTNEFKELCNACIRDEQEGFFDNTECLDKPFAEAPIFHKMDDWHAPLEVTYKGSFAQLVYGPLPDFNDIRETLAFLHRNL